VRQVAVVIPSGDHSRDDSLAGLLQDLAGQTLRPCQIEIVKGVSPSGKARNLGWRKTSAEFVVFLDDDVRLGNSHVLQTLVDTLELPGVGLSGTAQLLPDDSSAFQRRCAQQIPRSVSEVVTQVTESDIVTTACCATRRSLLEEVGGFHDQILRGVDPELRQRYRTRGYRIVVAPGIWHTHPMPANWASLWKMAYRNGYSSAFAQKHFPGTVVYNPEGHTSEFEARPAFWRRLGWRALRLARALFRGQWGGLVYDVSYALGFLDSRFGGFRRRND